MFAAQKMQHYLIGNTIYLVSGVNPFKILVTKAGSLNAQLAKWSIPLSKYDMTEYLYGTGFLGSTSRTPN